MRDRQTCVGCGKQSPETETNYTLISAQFGWRLTRYKGPDGGLVVEWRCPTCWREYKRARTIKPGESNPPPPPDDAQPLRLRTPPMARPPTPMGSFRPRTPSTPGDDPARRSSTPGTPPPDRRPSSPQRASPAPQTPFPEPLPARPAAPRPSQSPPRPSQPPPGPYAPGRPGRGSR